MKKQFECERCKIYVPQAKLMTIPYCPICGCSEFMTEVDTVESSPCTTVSMGDICNTTSFNQERNKVDFEKLAKFTDGILFEAITDRLPLLKDDFENLLLFLNMITKSSSFAHKAHKELKRELELSRM